MARTHNRIVDAEPEPVDESTLPRVPIWPIYVTGAFALIGAVLFLMHPTDPMFWIAQLVFGAPLLFVWEWRWEKARKLGYREPKSPGAAPDGDFGGMWGPP